MAVCLCRAVRASNENWSPEGKDGSHRVECEVLLWEGVAFRFALIIVKVKVMTVNVKVRIMKVRVQVTVIKVKVRKHDCERKQGSEQVTRWWHSDLP